MVLEVWRQGQQVDLKLTPVQSEDGSYKLGIWVRDNIQGIGTSPMWRKTKLRRPGDTGSAM